jgi:hypothetical protein
MKLVAVIGHACSPGALVMTRLKSLALAQSALAAAAAAKVSALGSTQLPAAFCMAVYGMPFCSVGQFDVADRALDLLHVGSDAFIALATDAVRPLHRGAFADLALPLRADLGQVVGEVEGGARTVERWTRVILPSGSFTPGLAATMAGSFRS